MKYAVVKVIDGHYFVHAEGFSTMQAAKVSYHGLCQTLWNASDVLSAEVMIVDENLDCVEGFKERIEHAPTPEPTSEPEEVTGK